MILLRGTTWARDAGAVPNTYGLIRKATRKLLRDLGYAVPHKRRELSLQVRALASTYMRRQGRHDISLMGN